MPAMAQSVSVSSATTSDWITLPTETQHILDVEIASGATVTLTVESRRIGSTSAATIKQPNDVTSNWELTANESMQVPGGREYRINVSAYSGTGDVTLVIKQSQFPPAS